MLEQVAQAATSAAPALKILDIGVIGLLIKAAAEVVRDVIKAHGERSRFKAVQAKAEIEEAKTYGMAMLKDKSGQEKASLVAFCPSHIGYRRAASYFGERGQAHQREARRHQGQRGCHTGGGGKRELKRVGFEASIVELKVKRLASEDKSMRLTLQVDDPGG